MRSRPWLVLVLLLTGASAADEWQTRYSKYRLLAHPDLDPDPATAYIDFSDDLIPRTAREVVYVEARTQQDIKAVIETVQTRFALEPTVAETLVHALVLDGSLPDVSPAMRGRAIERIRELYDRALRDSGESPVVLRELIAFLLWTQNIPDAAAEALTVVKQQKDVPRAALTATGIAVGKDRLPFWNLAREKYGTNPIVLQVQAMSSLDSTLEAQALEAIFAREEPLDPALRAVFVTRRIHTLLQTARMTEAIAFFDSLTDEERKNVIERKAVDTEVLVDGVRFLAIPLDVT